MKVILSLLAEELALVGLVLVREWLEKRRLS